MTDTALRNTMQTLDIFTEIRNTMPLQYLRAFMLVAMEEGKNVTWYAGKAGISASLMTRHLEDLGAVNRYREPGFGLVDQFANPMDRRERLTHLSAKGKHVVKQIGQAHQR